MSRRLCAGGWLLQIFQGVRAWPMMLKQTITTEPMAMVTRFVMRPGLTRFSGRMGPFAYCLSRGLSIVRHFRLLGYHSFISSLPLTAGFAPKSSGNELVLSP